MAQLGSITAQVLLEIPGGDQPVRLGGIEIPLEATYASAKDTTGAFITYSLGCDLREVKSLLVSLIQQSPTTSKEDN